MEIEREKVLQLSEMLDRCSDTFLTLIPVAKQRLKMLEEEIKEKQKELNALNELREYYSKNITEADVLEKELWDVPDYRYL
jgi:hypothetical protein